MDTDTITIITINDTLKSKILWHICQNTQVASFELHSHCIFPNKRSDCLVIEWRGGDSLLKLQNMIVRNGNKGVTLWQCENVTLWHCDNVKMWHCDNVKMWHCDNLFITVQCSAMMRGRRHFDSVRQGTEDVKYRNVTEKYSRENCREIQVRCM